MATLSGEDAAVLQQAVVRIGQCEAALQQLTSQLTAAITELRATAEKAQLTAEAAMGRVVMVEEKKNTLGKHLNRPQKFKGEARAWRD